MSEEALLQSEEQYEEPLPPHDEEDSPIGSSEINVIINGNSEQNVKPDATTAQDMEEDVLLGDDDDSDDEEVVVTIGQIKQNVPFSAAKAAGNSVGKLDIDGTPTINGEPIYDLDLAQMEERPWRKPGADITDYFNYGFCEETWNTYCERQRKLRSEYGTQASINKALFSSITLVTPVSQNTTLTGGRQLQTIPILGQEKSSMDLSGFKLEANQQPIMRTVLTGTAPRTVGSGGTSGTSLSVSTVSVLDGTSDGVVAPLAPDNSVPALTTAATSGTPDFTKAPPDFSKPPPVIDITNAANKNNVPIPAVSALSNLSVPASDGPPGVDEPAPPGSSTPPPNFSDMNARHIPTVDTSIPPPGFNPMLPPPGIGAPPPVRLGLPNTNMPPPGFSVPPPNFSQPPLNFPPPGFGAPTTPLSRPPPLMSRPTFPPPGLERRELKDDDKDRSDRDRCRERERDRDSGDSGEDDYGSSRRRYRRRSRSYSPRSSRRHRDDRERDRDSERYREKDRDRESRSRRHRSRSGSLYESSRSSRRKEERDNKDKEKRRNKKDESGMRTKEELIEEKDDDKKEGSERKKEDSERNDRDKDKGKDRDRKKRRHRSDDDSPDKREKEKKMKTKDDPSA
uniref:FIP1-like 1 protein n=1 Tax=Onchocerca volvulus TaxID=6282 RepID=A0A8R1TZX1_ONCVO